MKAKDITGQKFNMLTAIKFDHKKCTYTELGGIKRSKHYWLCKCDCGNFTVVRKDQLVDGTTKSCGCLHDETAAKLCISRSTHSLANHRLYEIWSGIKKRCFNKNSVAYHNYGGRGITICDEWKNDFKAFYDWSMANGYEDNLTIDRIDNDGNYEPSNCRFATMKEQNNNRRDNKLYTINGISLTLSQWCDKYNKKYKKVAQRIRKNKPIEEALFAP